MQEANNRVTALVRRNGTCGLFVTVESVTDGFIHISEINRPQGHEFKPGQQIIAWVMDYNLATNRLALTMFDPSQVRTFTQLRIGQQLQGQITSIESYGVFVDVGVGHDGLVHISKISKFPISSIRDILSENHNVTVWVERVDVNEGKLSLTMIPPPNTDWRTLSPNQTLVGTVVKIETFGAFVDIGAEINGLVHVSEMSHGYVTNPAQFVQIGHRITVRVLSVDLGQKRIALTMK